MEKKGGKEFVEAVIELRKKNGPLDIAGGEAALRDPHPAALGLGSASPAPPAALLGSAACRQLPGAVCLYSPQLNCTHCILSNLYLSTWEMGGAVVLQ